MEVKLEISIPVGRGLLRRLGAVLALAITTVVVAASSESPAACAGTQCAPTTGYTYDRYWDCGPIYDNFIQSCWFPGYLGRPTGNQHTWGWGSADWDGGGSIGVGLDASTTSQSRFGGVGTNLMRACYYDGCYDQDGLLLDMRVFHTYREARRTIFGHGKA
jgi:hypothetical protein